jgi:hypothetical protein
MKCLVCDRETSEKYCEFHKKAYSNLIEKFECWQRALGVSWKDYLEAVAAHSFTGAWAKEVALGLLSEMKL